MSSNGGSCVNINDYPEHLNPFYDDDNHNRIRFWAKTKKLVRSNSLTFNGINSSFKGLRNSFRDPKSRRNTLSKEDRIQVEKTAAPDDSDQRLDAHGFLIPSNTRHYYQHILLTPHPQPKFRSSYDSYSTLPTERRSSSRFAPKATSTPEKHPLTNRTSLPLANDKCSPRKTSTCSLNPFDDEHFTADQASTSKPSSTVLPRKKRRAPLPPGMMINKETGVENAAENLSDSGIEILDTSVVVTNPIYNVPLIINESETGNEVAREKTSSTPSLELVIKEPDDPPTETILEAAGEGIHVEYTHLIEQEGITIVESNDPQTSVIAENIIEAKPDDNLIKETPIANHVFESDEAEPIDVVSTATVGSESDELLHTELILEENGDVNGDKVSLYAENALPENDSCSEKRTDETTETIIADLDETNQNLHEVINDIDLRLIELNVEAHNDQENALHSEVRSEKCDEDNSTSSDGDDVVIRSKSVPVEPEAAVSDRKHSVKDIVRIFNEKQEASDANNTYNLAKFEPNGDIATKTVELRRGSKANVISEANGLLIGRDDHIDDSNNNVFEDDTTPVPVPRVKSQIGRSKETISAENSQIEPKKEQPSPPTVPPKKKKFYTKFNKWIHK